MTMSPETDILIVAFNQERFATEIRTAFRHWQVYSVASPHVLHGRRFGRVFVTRPAIEHRNWPEVEMVIKARLAAQGGGELLSFEQDYVEPTSPDPQDFADAVLLSELRRSRHPYS